MQPTVVAIVVFAALVHAVWNIASKYKQGDSLLFIWAYTCISAVLWVPIGATYKIYKNEVINWHMVEATVVSAFLHLIYSLTLQTGYDRAELGVVYPIARGTGPVLTMICAILFLDERLSLFPLFGALLIILGTLIVTGNPFGRVKSSSSKGIIWGLIIGISITAYTLWDSYAVKSLHLSPIIYYTGTLLMQTLIICPIALSRWYNSKCNLFFFRNNLFPIFIIGVMSPLAYILVLNAMLMAPLFLVAPLRESSIIIGSILGYFLFHEKKILSRLIGASIVLAGIAAISLG